jgi:ubiquinone/menaquinone biosynthesis C-methylase UbiE
VRDPLAGSSWSSRETVAGFAAAAPNATLVQVAERELHRVGRGHAVDVGCGAGRNAVPLARQGWNIVGVDLSLPMIGAARERAAHEGIDQRATFALAAMDSLPVRDRSCDLVVAHGIWNLAPSADVFRRAVREAARVSRIGAALFVFTFSRNTLPPRATPLPNEPFVFADHSGVPRCFLTEHQLRSELKSAGFTLDSAVGLRELNRPGAGTLSTIGSPVIYEGTFRYHA